MSSLSERFATLDRVPMPELWSDVQQRAAQLRSAERVTFVTVGIPVRSTGRRERTLALLAAAALLVALLAGAIAVGSGYVRLPAVVPAPVVSTSPAPSPISATASPSITAEPSAVATSGRSPWIVFHRDGSDGLPESSDLLWAMRADGSGAHEIQAGSFLAVGWSRDGSRLLLNNGHILVAEIGDEIGPFIDTGVEVPVNEQWEAFDFAPDGERVIYVRDSKCAAGSSRNGLASSGVVLANFVAETAGANCNVLSILDLRTGERTDLEETFVSDTTGDPPSSLELPAWSPDGTKIAYTRTDQTLRTGGARELWVVNADGTIPSRVELAADVAVQEPRWSPDGTRLSFTSATLDSTVYVVDLASRRLERVTTGSGSVDHQLCCAEWIDDSHLRVGGRTDLDRFWLVALNAGPREAPVLADLTDSLSALDAPAVTAMRSAPGDPGRTFFWQPTREAQP